MSALLEPARRLALGQWFTPPAVADLALALALPPGPRAGLRVLDPSCGDGVFLVRAAAAGVIEGGLSGIELDPAAAATARAALPGAAIRCEDLFARPTAATGERGFDVVVGNPPYVRQERLSAAQKQRAERCLAADWPDLSPDDRRRLVGRGDLAASVVARALRLCRPGGRVALVVSSALLDASSADPLWRLVERHGRVVALVDAPSERWFRDAAVNTVVLVLERDAPAAAAASPSVASALVAPDPAASLAPPDSPAAPVQAAPPRTPVAIARLNVPTAVAAARVRELGDLAAVADLRHAPGGSPRAWAAALRAPAAWYELVREAGDLLVPLGALAEVRRGVTSGANDVFYLARDRAAALGLEPALLAPLLRSPREPGSQTIAVDPAALPTVVLLAPASAAELARSPAAHRYLLDRSATADRPTLRARSPWWWLPVRPARLFLTKAYAARFVQRFSPSPVVADQRLYSIHPAAGVAEDLLAAVLSTTFTALALESLGRASLGEGALEWTVGDAAHLPVLDPRRLDDQASGELRAALAALAPRPIGPVDAERDRQDRARLDRAAGGRLAALLPDVHDALCASVARRAARAGARLPGRGLRAGQRRRSARSTPGDPGA